MARINYRDTYNDADAARAASQRIRDTADWYFNSSTKAQQEERNTALRCLMGVTGPSADRQRAEIKAKYERDTAKARKLRERTERCLYRTGEVSEAISFAWDRLDARSAKKEAA